MSQDTIIKLKNLEYKEGHKYLLRDISWEIKRGEHWAVFGMNGSGKTTLLRRIGIIQRNTEQTKYFANAEEHRVGICVFF